MNPKDDGITLGMVMQHMQGMEQRLRDEFRSGLGSLEIKVDRNNDVAERRHAQVMTGLDNIDARLDDLEVVQVPAIKKAVGMK